jgi:uncharacterized protein (DUF608 family)
MDIQDDLGDGLPEHLGIPDQTFDNWNTEGVMTYTSMLYLVSLKCGIAMAKSQKDVPTQKKLQARFDKAQKSFLKKLWDEKNGYFKLSEHNTDVFSDSLPFLFAKMLGFSIVDDRKVQSHLKKVFKTNVLGFGKAGYGKGYLGAVNGHQLSGAEIDPKKGGEQGSELWTGTSYATGAAMLAYGLKDEGWQTIFGTYNLVENQTNSFGMWAEAYTLEPGIGDGPMYGFRARTYYRVLANWNVWILDVLKILENQKK